MKRTLSTLTLAFFSMTHGQASSYFEGLNKGYIENINSSKNTINDNFYFLEIPLLDKMKKQLKDNFSNDPSTTRSKQPPTVNRFLIIKSRGPLDFPNF